jgi:hypothetical protein
LKADPDHLPFQRNKAQMAVLTWTISTAVADIGIAAALIWQLRSMKSTFRDTQS